MICRVITQRVKPAFTDLHGTDLFFTKLQLVEIVFIIISPACNSSFIYQMCFTHYNLL